MVVRPYISVSINVLRDPLVSYQNMSMSGSSSLGLPSNPNSLKQLRKSRYPDLRDSSSRGVAEGFAATS
jgi:hypothetical protein